MLLAAAVFFSLNVGLRHLFKATGPATAGAVAPEKASNASAVRVASSYTARLVRLMRQGQPFPHGKAAMEAMYRAFLEDVATDGPHIPPRAPSVALRVMSFNVHFWQRGYSRFVYGSNVDGALAAIQQHAPDALLLQEVIPGPGNGSYGALERLGGLGYVHQHWVPAPDAHILPAGAGPAAGQRLQTALLSRWPLRGAAGVALGGGGGEAAFAEVALPRAGGARVGLYSLHASTRCPAQTRLDEANAMLAHARRTAAAGAADAASAAPLLGALFGGDFNQPARRDYPPDEWAAMAQDMRGAGLPLTDGVAEAMVAGGLRHSFEEAQPARARPPGTSAWSGGLVDFIWHLRAPPGSPGLRCAGSWLAFTGASDHLPLVADYVYEPAGTRETTVLRR